MFLICFISQWMKRSKHGLFVFLPKKTLIWRRHFSIGQSCCSMTSKRSIDWFLESPLGMKFFHPTVRLTNLKLRAFVSVRQTNHSRPQCLRVWECALDLSPLHAQKSSGSRLQTNQIALFPFVCCFCFVRAFSFQCHTKIAQTRLQSRYSEQFTCDCEITASC